jgi:hypothetical protein
MELGDYIIGTLVFAAIILSITTIFSEMNSNNPNFIDDQELYSSFNTTFNNYNALENQTTELKNRVSNASLPNNDVAFGGITDLMNTAYLGLKYILTSFSGMTAVFLGLNKVFGIPDWVGAILILIVTVIIVFAILKVVFRVQI